MRKITKIKLATFLCISTLFLWNCVPTEPADPNTKTGVVHKDLIKKNGLKQSNAPVFSSSFRDANMGRLSVPGPMPATAYEPLEIERLDVDVMIIGRMARTQVTQVFKNHTNRRTEGTYEFTLPHGASISRLAMDVQGKLMEGELVEREKARMIYEHIVRRQKDPALLEWQGGNRFKTQVFPIEARATKKVVLSYEQILPSHNHQLKYSYALPNLVGQPQGSKLGSFSFVLRSKDGVAFTSKNYTSKITPSDPGGEVHYKAQNFVPGGPFEVLFEVPRTEQVHIDTQKYKDTNHFLIDFVPTLATNMLKSPTHLVFALDTSAGIGTPVLKQSVEVVRGLIERAAHGVLFQVVSGDLDVHLCGQKPLVRDEAKACLATLTSGGATNLEALLVTAATQAFAMPGPTSLVVFTDGAASIGEMDAELIQANTIKALGLDDKISLHTVAVGHNPDEEGLRQLARKGRGQSMRMTPVQHAASFVPHMEAIISKPLLLDVQVKVVAGDVSHVVPSGSFHVASGEAVAVMGQFKGEAKLAIEGTYLGEPWKKEVRLFEGDKNANALLPKFWARRRIKTLQKKDAPRADMVKLSLDYGVMSPFTSFLVLESDAAYTRYKIERRKEEEKKRAAAEKAKMDAISDASKKLEADKKLKAQGDLQEEDEESVASVPKDTSSAAQDKPAPQQANLKKSSGTLQDLLRSKPAKPARPAAKIASPSPRSAGQELDAPSEGRSLNDELMPEPVAEPPRRRRPLEKKMKMKKKRRSSNRADVSGGLTTGAPGLGLRGVGRGGGGRSKGFGIGRLSRERKGKGYGSGHAAVTLKLGVPFIHGSLDKNIIRRLMRKHRPALRYCFMKEVLEQPHSGGKVELMFTINASGRVGAAKVSSKELRNRLIKECMTRIVQRMRFPKPNAGGTVKVRYPLHIKGPKPSKTFLAERKKRDKARLEELEERLVDLKRAERVELLELYVSGKKYKKSRAWFAKLKDRVPKEDSPHGWLELLRIEATRNFFDNDFTVAASARLMRPDPPDELFGHVAQSLAKEKNTKQLIATFGTHALTPQNAALVVLRQLEFKHLAGARALWPLVTNRYTDKDRVTFLNALGAPKELQIERFAMWGELARKKAAPRSIMEHYFELGIKQGKAADVFDLFETACDDMRLPLKNCGVWLARFEKHKIPAKRLARVRDKMRQVHQKELDALQQKRSEDMGNTKLILKMVSILEVLGDQTAARRMLSEIVEFAPHDYHTRMTYAHQLVSRTKVEDGCNQYATAVQLNPSKRNTFRTMMGLRRQNGSKAKAVRDCIVSGVSRLPVKRAVSILLTWESNGTDVDLHIDEVGGHHVYYRKRESKNGGLLYYDITNGYGPEIYVLGSGPAGTYPISLVYYRGIPKNLKGTLTILRDAGSAQESRKDISFVLPTQNRNKKIRVGEFILTERDRAGDKSKVKPMGGR